MIKQRIADISGYLIGINKTIHVNTWIAFFCTISILIISIKPVSVSESESEIYLCFLIPIIAIIGFLTAFIRKIELRFCWIDCIVVCWYVYAMCRLWFDATYPAAGFAIRASLMCMLYVAMRILLSGSRLSGNIIIILLIVFSIVEACLGYSQIFSGTSRHHLYPVTGSFLNPGPYSAYLAMGIVALCKQRLTINDKRSIFASYRSFDEIILNFLIVFLSVPLAMTMSRAAFLAVCICLVILFHDRIKGWSQWGVLIAAAVICSACFYFLKAGSANGRGIINYIGMHCFLDYPLWGNGTGSFFHQYALKTAEISMLSPDTNLISVDVIDYSFNDLLLIGVEQGLMGLAFAIALICFVMHRLWERCRPLFFVALSLLIFSLFSYPFELLPYQIIGVIIASYSATKQVTTNADKRNSILYDVLKSITVMTCILCISYVCYNAVRERLEAENDYRMFAGLHDRAFIKDYYSLLNYLDDNKHFLFDFAKILSEQERYNDSNDMLRRGALVSNDPMFLVLQGNNYRDMEAYDLAEKAFLLAWHTMPNRIYPLYQLMKLHEQTGNKDKAKAYAERIIEFKEKIPSPAVNDIKMEAHEINDIIITLNDKNNRPESN